MGINPLRRRQSEAPPGRAAYRAAARTCLAAMIMATLAVVTPASPATAQTSPLGKTGTDVQTGSTTTAGPGDTIDWVVSSTNPTDGPVNAVITDPIQSAGTDQTYVPGSLQVPPGFTPEWSTDGGTTFSATDQGTATDVVRASNPDFQSPATATSELLLSPFQGITTPTGGDGYTPILFTTSAGVPEVWNIFHHLGSGANAPQVVCTDRLTGLPCAGFSGAKYLSTTPGPLGTGPADVQTPTPVAAAHHPSDPALIYISVLVPDRTPHWSVGLLCINLETRSNCGYTELKSGAANHGSEALLVGTKVYTYLPTDGQMGCLDTATNAPCAGQPYPAPAGVGASLPTAINGQIFGGTVTFVGANVLAWCFDTTTGLPCTGWSTPKTVGGAGSSAGFGPRFATYDAAGQPTGVCIGWSGTAGQFAFGCFDLAGNPAPTPPGLQVPGISAGFIWEMLETLQVEAPNGHAVTFFPVVQDRPGFGFASFRNGGTLCYDWTTSAPCAGFPDDSGIDAYDYHSNVNGGNTRDYGYAYDGQCGFGLGDSGRLFTFDPVTGSTPCQKTTATMTLDPSAFYCDGAAGHVQGYDSVSLQDIDLATVNFASSSVTVTDGDGNVLGTFPFDPLTGEADISSIPATTSPIEATLDIALISSSSFTPTNHPRAVLSFVGDAPQMCFQTVVAADCTAIEVSNQATATYVPSDGGDAIDATSPLVTLAVTGASSTASATHGSAYGVDVAALGVHLLNKIGNVGTADPGGPGHAARRILTATLPGLVNLGVITTGSDSALAPPPSTSTATAEIANVNLLGGAVTASAIKAVSQSTASAEAATYSSAGSGFVNLKINGVPITNVAPNTTVEVKNPLIPSQVIAAAYLYEETGSRSIAGGQASATHQVNMIRLVLVKPLLALPAGAEIIVSHAQSDVVAPACSSEALSVSGEAFTASVAGTLLGQQIQPVKVGDAVLPSQGGSDSDGTPAAITGIVTSGTTVNTTSGTLDPNPDSTSHSVVQGLNVLSGLVTADVLDVASTSSADGTTAGTTLAVTFANLKVGGVTVNVNVAPNTTINVPSGGGLVRVVLNEQVVNSNGTTDTEGTVNAIHVSVFNGSGLFSGEVIVASAHSDAHV
ncbi:MAG: hypothetical protein QOG82_312 [Actinomycetota bacterium]|nr:hypothetical protein [Actinomycetota bacterium]